MVRDRKQKQDEFAVQSIRLLKTVKKRSKKKGYVEKANGKSCLATTGVIIVAFFEFMFIFYALRNFSNGWLYLIYFGILFAIIIFYFTEISNYVKRSEEGRLLYSNG